MTLLTRASTIGEGFFLLLLVTLLLPQLAANSNEGTQFVRVIE
jgi:hypothetical protein